VQIYYGPDGQSLFENYSVVGFAPNDVWFSTGGSYAHYNGISFTTGSIFPQFGGVTKLWGTSSNNLYGVGSPGLIVRYNGTQWTRMESGTTVQLSDVYGTPDGKEVWACGFSRTNGKGVILRLKNGQWEKVWSTESNSPLWYGYPTSIWMTGNRECYILDMVFSGQIYLQPLFDTDRPFSFKRLASNVPNASYKVRGSSKSNVAVCGYYGAIFHFNGSTWKNYLELIDVNRTLYGLAVSEKQIIAVGIEDDQLYALPIVVRGRRP
jgi:hypothetical protein